MRSEAAAVRKEAPHGGGRSLREPEATPARAAEEATGWSGALLCLPLALTLALVVYWPLSHLFSTLFTRAGSEALWQVLSAGRYRTSLLNSLLLSVAAAALSLLLSLIPAWVLARECFRGQGLLRGLISLPLTFSGVLVGFLAVVMLGRAGAVPSLLRFLTGRELLAGSAYTLGGLFTAYLYFEVPRAVMTLEPSFRRIPRELDAAARSLGAVPLSRFGRVFLPIAAPALRATFALAFSASLGSFGVALMLARRFTVAPLEVYTQLTGFSNDSVAGALCLVLAASSFLADRLLSGGRA